MAARLRFSIAAAKTHDVLLIDEALATGDPAFQKRSEDRIRELRKDAGTVFLVSHNNKSIRDTCDRTIWLEAGVIRADGATEDVVAEYEDYMKATRGAPSTTWKAAGDVTTDHRRPPPASICHTEVLSARRILEIPLNVSGGRGCACPVGAGEGEGGAGVRRTPGVSAVGRSSRSV